VLVMAADGFSNTRIARGGCLSGDGRQVAGAVRAGRSEGILSDASRLLSLLGAAGAAVGVLALLRDDALAALPELARAFPTPPLPYPRREDKQCEGNGCGHYDKHDVCQERHLLPADSQVWYEGERHVVFLCIRDWLWHFPLGVAGKLFVCDSSCSASISAQLTRSISGAM
jgi:hypothetical protein